MSMELQARAFGPLAFHYQNARERINESITLWKPYADYVQCNKISSNLVSNQKNLQFVFKGNTIQIQ